MHYLRYGGLPSLVAVSAEQAFTALDDSYAAVMLHDVIERRGARPLTDAQLLRTIAQYLAAHLGTPLSVSTLGPKVQATRPIPSFHTVQAYVRALCDSYCCTAVKRYDLKRHEYLSTLGKFYWADLGRCHYLSGALSSPCGQPELEHVVYWELIGRGYNVALGKLDQHEVSFIATRATERLYLQVTPSLRAPEHRSRVLTPLRKLDANSKLVLTLEPGLYTEAGITVRYVIDWLRDSFEQESESLSTGQAPRS